MKYILLLLFVINFSSAAFSKKKEENTKFDEIYRAQYHFSPNINKMGNPISVWFSDSTYKMVFQQNPYNLLPGFINWGLASSSDLLLWDEKGLVIEQPGELGDSMLQVPWFGSVCKNKDGLIAWVNRWNDGIYQTKSADGMTWSDEVKTKGTEKLANSEPQVFWYEATQKWVMVVFERETTTMFILNSSDGIDWEQTSTFNFTLGFPQLFELPVDRKADDTRWVLATEKGTYMLGKFDGKVFNLETSIRKFNNSTKIGASTFFKDPKTGNTIGFSSLIGAQMADLPSNGQLSFPMNFALHQFEHGIELLQTPIGALESLHGKPDSWEAKKIYPGLKNNLLKGVKGKSLHMKAVIDILSCDQFGFLIRSNKMQEGTEISYNVKKAQFNFLGTQLDYQPVNKKIEIELLIDRSSIEVLIDGGRYVMSYPFEPSPEALQYELFTVGGEIMVDHLDVFPLKSVWRTE
ncbi:MAG: glycoside hydrolase family 32 protein [Prolixibacteraceae bacterium]